MSLNTCQDLEFEENFRCRVVEFMKFFTRAAEAEPKAASCSPPAQGKAASGHLQS